MTNKRPPVIGLTCLAINHESDQTPPRFAQNQSYLRAMTRAGAAPLLLPQETDEWVLRTLYDRLDGILFPGGEDVDPARYGEPVHLSCGCITPERDAQELALARWAVQGGKPLLAICRGIQVLNVALDGSLYQDIAAQLPQAGQHAHVPGRPRNHLAHQISVRPQTHLAAILGKDDLWVNSMHHQAIKEIAPPITVSAQAPDQVVEGAEVADHPFAVAVQWHPEELAASESRQQRLFDAFVDACRV